MLVDFFFGDFTEIADKFVAGFRLEIALVEDDAEWALELEVFDVHGMSDAGLFKVAHGPAGHDSDARSVDDGALDGGDAADLHDDVESSTSNSASMRACSKTRRLPEPASRMMNGSPLSSETEISWVSAQR